MDGLYIPTVTPIEIEGVDKTSTDVQGATQRIHLPLIQLLRTT